MYTTDVTTNKCAQRQVNWTYLCWFICGSLKLEHVDMIFVEHLNFFPFFGPVNQWQEEGNVSKPCKTIQGAKVTSSNKQQTELMVWLEEKCSKRQRAISQLIIKSYFLWKKYPNSTSLLWFYLLLVNYNWINLGKTRYVWWILVKKLLFVNEQRNLWLLFVCDYYISCIICIQKKFEIKKIFNRRPQVKITLTGYVKMSKTLNATEIKLHISNFASYKLKSKLTWLFIICCLGQGLL